MSLIIFLDFFEKYFLEITDDKKSTDNLYY